MNALTSSRPRRGACSEYCKSMSGAPSSSTILEFRGIAPELRCPKGDPSQDFRAAAIEGRASIQASPGDQCDSYLDYPFG